MALALAPTFATVAQGGTTQVVATLTWGGGFAADVALSLEGAPAGVTGAVSNTLTSEGSASATVTISVSEDAAPGSHGLTVRARGTGAADATAAFVLTVTVNATPRRIAAGSFHTLAIKSDGTLWAWGNNAAGQLGNGTTADRLSPTPIGF
jgi:hypothetical protein